MQKTRTGMQLFFFSLAVLLTLRNLLGLTKAHVESYCPGGAWESIIFYLNNHAFLCATSGINLILFVAVAIGTILFGRMFCSWVCPVGTMVEFLRESGKTAGTMIAGFWNGAGKVIGFGRYIVAGFVLFYTYKIQDLIFRGFCPYYVVISGQEHEVAAWSKWFMLGVGLLCLFIPFFWCRVLCPFGAFLGITKLLSPISPVIREKDCVSCGQCSKLCPQEIPVMDVKRVWSPDCTQCLVCVDSCPKRCIVLGVGYGTHPAPAAGSSADERSPKKGTDPQKTSDGLPQGRGFVHLRKKWVPVAVLLTMGLGFFFAFRIPLPTLTLEFPAMKSDVKFATVDLIIKGLRCRGTAMSLGNILKKDPGVAAMDAFAPEARAHITYDPSKTDPRNLETAIDGGWTQTDKKSGKTSVIKPFKVEKIQEP